ncbi:MAG: ribonuclease HIII [Bacilli bacterium]|nr:ribonuclease HIII [Bacilli bacterium]
MKKKVNHFELEVDEDTYAKILYFYKDSKEASPNEYIELFARGEGFTVSVYKRNKKGIRKAVWQGNEAVHEGKIFATPNDGFEEELEIISPAKPSYNPKMSLENQYPQIGSDEVGTGDFFGPICVCAAYVRESDLPRLKELGVTDSKLLSDEKILSIGPILIKEFHFSQISISNEKYNEVHPNNNMNMIKAKIHNQCLLNMKRKYPEAKVYLDQFAEPKTYFSYLKNEKEVVKDIVFSPKGELHFPSVALGSVIARYSFLLKMKAIGEKYQMEIPFGAGEEVDKFAKKFIERYGLDELRKIVKTNFANFKRLI